MQQAQLIASFLHPSRFMATVLVPSPLSVLLLQVKQFGIAPPKAGHSQQESGTEAETGVGA